MRKKRTRLLSIILVFGMLLANILHENTPVQAAGDSSSDLYRWYQAKSVDDLKEYAKDKTSYKGKWIPIIIVATYADGTSYYWNRKTRMGTWHSGESELIPQDMMSLGYSKTGLVLKNGMKSGKEFYSKGDLGALHMYYHGNVTSNYEDGYVKADAWSLTNDAVEDNSTTAASTVYGIQNHSSYVALDQNNVKQWRGADALPVTYSPRGSSKDQFEQAWTFYEDRYSDCFLISNMFSWAKRYKLKDGWDGIYAPTIGCVLSGASRFADPSEKHRDTLEAPSRAAAVIYSKKAEGKVLRGEDARQAILKQYEKKYNKASTRVRFKIFVGQKVKGQQTWKSTTIEKNQTDVVGNGNVIPKDTSIFVEQGATLVIPEDTFVFLDGTIINEGTVIIEKNAVVTSEKDSRNENAQIVCQNGGNLLVMDNACVFLGKGLVLKDASAVNKGTLIAYKNFVMQNAQMQMADRGRMFLGFSISCPSILREKVYGHDLYQEKGLFFEGIISLSNRGCQITMDGASVIVLDANSELCYANGGTENAKLDSHVYAGDAYGKELKAKRISWSRSEFSYK